MLCGAFIPSCPSGLTDDDRARLWPGQASAGLYAGRAARPIVASVSGGKDSTAMALWLLEQGLTFEPVFIDTGWEHPTTYDYLDGPLTAVLGRITRLRADQQMAALIRHKSMFPSHRRRFCTAELKLRPFEHHLLECYPEGNAINAVGIRADESRARAGLPRWSSEDGLLSFVDTWRPLIAWDEAQVRAMHSRHGLPLNPLYGRGAARVGCWPCIYARRAEIRLLAEHDPERVATIRKLEQEVLRAAEQRGARGSTFFFNPARGPIPIDEAVRWARRREPAEDEQDELFDPGEGRRGCMRFGLCDFPSDDALPARAVSAPSSDGGVVEPDELHRLAYDALLLDDLPQARALHQRLLAELGPPSDDDLDAPPRAARAVLNANLAHVLARLGLERPCVEHVDRARVDLDRIDDLAARGRLANQLAWTLRTLPGAAGAATRGLQLASQALELVAEGYRPAALDTRARLNLVVGRDEEAELDARRAQQVAPAHPGLQDLYAELLQGVPHEREDVRDTPPPATGGLEPIGY